MADKKPVVNEAALKASMADKQKTISTNTIVKKDAPAETKGAKR